MFQDKKIVFTTSWDDGHKLDLRLAGLLSRYGLKGTFYIPKNCGFRSLGDQELKEIAREQEIGAHSLNHLELHKVSEETAGEEIFGSKSYLEELLGKEVKMFCYPGGYFTEATKRIAKEAGFLGARTTEEWHFGIGPDFFEMPTSLHIYPFPFRPLTSFKQYKNPKNFLKPLFHHFPNILKHNLSLKAFFSWQGLARSSFLYAQKHGEIFHLFGHSWEIEKYGMWKELEKFLKFVADDKDNLIFLTNGEVLDSLSES